MKLPDQEDIGAELADRYVDLWERSDSRPNLQAFLDQYDGLSSRDLADVLLVDQSFGWQAGSELPVEKYLTAWPRVAADPELRLDLVYGELRAFIDRGHLFDREAFLRRFPDLREQLVRQMAMGEWLQSTEGALAGSSHRDEATEGTVAIPAERRGSGVDPEAPMIFSDFEIMDKLGAGAMGDVYRARQRSLDKQVAIKILKRTAECDRTLVERFLREGRAVAAVMHPNIVDVHGIGRCPDGGYFLVMDLIEGASLDRCIEKELFSCEDAVHIVAEVAEAIAHANEQGVIHRDLKPSNVLLDNTGKAMVTDFGLAKLYQTDEPAVSKPGQIIGTVQYMAPEQADSRRWGEVSTATDVHGLGALLYALLVGRPPAEGSYLMELLAWLASDRLPAPPRSIRPEVPEAIESICMKCLSKNPADRYPSARKVAEALRGLTDTGTADGSVPATVSRLRRWLPAPRSRRSLLAVAALGSAVIAALAWLTYLFLTPLPLEVAWTVDVYRGTQQDNRIRLTDMPGPLFTGDKLRIHLTFTRSMYAYLFWIGSDGAVQQLYPGSADSEEAVEEITVPSSDTHVLPVHGDPGTEVCVLILRETALKDVSDLSGKLRPPAAFPPLDSNTIVKEDVPLPTQLGASSSEGGRRTSEFPSPEAWLAGERPRGLGPAEPLKVPAILDYFRLWRQNLPPDLGDVRYLALPHGPQRD